MVALCAVDRRRPWAQMQWWQLAKEGREPFMLVTDKAGMSNLVDSGVREPDEKIEGSRAVIATWN